jgi:iron(III) transport system ATP-binding protein
LSETQREQEMPDQTQALLQLQGISKSFGQTPVVREIDLEVGPSEFICLLGASGCGKTTLLRIICGIKKPDAGRLIYRDQDITSWEPAQRRFGIVFQSYALFPNLTVLDNITYGLSGMSREHQRARALDMLDLVGLSALSKRFPAQLSGGQQQRIALARALTPSPSLLLLDEPLSALDAQVRHTLRAELKRIQRELKMPVVMVTHDQQEAMELADRIMLMNQGQIEQSGTPRELYGYPQSKHVAQFTGRANIWPALYEKDAYAQPVLCVGQALLRVACDPISLINADAQLQLMIRPEHVQLSQHVRATQADAYQLNQYNAVVEDIVYSGANQTLKLRVPQLNSMIHAESSGELDQAEQYQIGHACSVILPPEHLRVLSR